MEPQSIENWLRRKQRRCVVSNYLLAVVALLAGVVVLFLTFWLTYAIIWVGWAGVSAATELILSKTLPLGHEWRLGLSGVFIVLLFLQHARTDPWHWGDYPRRNYVAAPGLQYQAGVLGGLVFMLAYPGASANMVADILLSGPRLVVGAWRLVKKSGRMKHLDASGCSQLLAFLGSRPGAVPYEELREAGWDDWLVQLREIDGVVFLEKGLSLSAELRQELSGLRGA